MTEPGGGGPAGRRAADERGPRIVLSQRQALGRRQTLTIFAFIVLAFVLLAYRTETADDRLVRNVVEACENRNDVSPIINCDVLR